MQTNIISNMRTVDIRVRVTPEEKEACKGLAGSLTLSDWIRVKCGIGPPGEVVATTEDVATLDVATQPGLVRVKSGDVATKVPFGRRVATVVVPKDMCPRCARVGKPACAECIEKAKVW